MMVRKIWMVLLTNTLLLANFTTAVYAQPTTDLSEAQQQLLIQKIDSISTLDQQYRSIIALGTLDEDLLEKDRQLRQTASLEEYLAFKKTVPQTLTTAQKDSLWALQHALDGQNYQTVRAMIRQYGYPSNTRLGVSEDKLFAVLLHPPVELDANDYLTTMQELLLPEVQASRMEAMAYAQWYDNIKAKILREPQLYGTNKSFNPATMSMGPAVIKDLAQTNAARSAIGLPELQEGEYQLAGN